MTKFIFEDKSSFELTLKSNVKVLNNINDDLEDEITEEKGYNLTKTLKNYLNFMSQNNLIPYLPKEIKIVYVNENKTIYNLLMNRKVSYPACMIAEKGTLYISRDFELSNSELSLINSKNLKEEYILDLRRHFNQDHDKVLEYIFGHELGHFYILTKNHGKDKLDKNKFIQSVARNIEEGFSEAFSIHLMCLKDKNFNFESIKNSRHQDSDLRIKNKTDKSVLAEERLGYFTKVGFEKLIDTYNFKTIYDYLPIKDINGNIEKDINKIYEECLNIAKNNNKEVINDIVNNKIYKDQGLSKIFVNGLKNTINNEPNVDQLNTNDLIDKIHKKISGTSFNTKKMKMLREKFLNNQNESTYKPK